MMKNNEKTLEESIALFVKAVKDAWVHIGNVLRKKWGLFKEAAVKWYQLEEGKPIKIQNQHRRDFSGQKISHQVIDRKPKHMVRKKIH